MQQLKVIKLGVPEPWEKLPGSGLPGLSPPPLAARHRSWETALTIPHCSPRAGRHGPAQRPSQRALQGITRPGKQFPSQLSPDCQRPCRKAFSYCSRGSHIAQLVKNLPTMQESPSLIPGLGRSTGEGTGCPLQCSGLENSADCTVHGVAKSQTRPRDFHFTFMGFSDHLTWLLRNLYFSGNQVRKQQLELDMEQQTGSKLGKKYVKSVYCHPAYLIYAEYIM